MCGRKGNRLPNLAMHRSRKSAALIVVIVFKVG